jgi:large subunit ribosomal protein L29
MSKAAEKFSNLSPEELKHQEREQMDQLFRLKFQLKMGQSESLNKIRSLRRNVARLKTYRRQHELGIHAVAAPKTEAKASTATAAAKTTAKKTSSKKTAAKSAARKAGKK